jgi:hypothetical protein
LAVADRGAWSSRGSVGVVSISSVFGFIHHNYVLHNAVIRHGWQLTGTEVRKRGALPLLELNLQAARRRAKA